MKLDYCPYGMLLEGRNGNTSAYRYGQNGQEKVDEIKGTGNHYTAPYWEYDPRLGRRWNVDPVVKFHESPYATFANNPIWFADPDGADSIQTASGAWAWQIEEGDTYWGIGQKTGVNYKDLQAWNEGRIPTLELHKNVGRLIMLEDPNTELAAAANGPAGEWLYTEGEADAYFEDDGMICQTPNELREAAYVQILGNFALGAAQLSFGMFAGGVVNSSRAVQNIKMAPSPTSMAPTAFTHNVKTSPIKIPSSAEINYQVKANGYYQVSYRWTQGGYKYEARWHTPTPNAPEGSGNTWVVSRITPGNSTGQQKVVHIYTGNGQWTPAKTWQSAVSAYQSGTASPAQIELLRGGHFSAP